MATYKNQCSSGSHASRFILLLDVTIGAQNIASNLHAISGGLRLAGGNYAGDNYNQYGSSFYGYTCNGSIAVKNATTGASICTGSGSSSGTVSNTSAITIATFSGNAPHNADGTLTITITGTFTGGLSSQTSGGTITATITLPTIPRATSCPSGTYNIGQTYTIALSPASTSFTHKALFSIGSKSYTLSGSNSLSLNLNDDAIYDLFSTATYETSVTLETYNGSTKIGSKTGKFVIACDKNLCKPTITATYKDSNSTIVTLTGSNQKILKNKSTLAMTISPTAKHSTIDRVTIDGVKSSSNTSYTDSSPNKTSYVLKAYDKRGFESDSFTLNVTLIDYVDLSCSVEFYRVSPTTGEVGVRYSGNYFNSSFGSTANTLTIKYQYKEKGATTWSTAVSLTPVLKNNSYSQEKSLGSTFDYKKVYEFRLLVSDKLNNLTIDKIVAKGEPIFWINDNKMNLLVDLFIKGKNLVDYLYPVGSIYISIDSANPSTKFGGTWVRFANGKTLIGVDESNTEWFASAEVSKGNWTHTHNFSHTHGVPGANHSHGYGSLHADINFAGTSGTRYRTYSGGFTPNERKADGGAGYNYSSWCNEAVQVEGSTGATTPNAVTTNSQSTSTTASSTAVPPYVTVYMWKRTA